MGTSIRGGQQAGIVTNDRARAGNGAIWTGSAQSFIYLGSGYINDTDGKQQVGQTWSEHSPARARLWMGSQTSRVTLHPDWASASGVYGVDGGRQVGYTVRESEGGRAAIWSGSAKSWRSLHPSGAVWSEALDIHRKVQVGVAQFTDGIPLAGLWRGNSKSWTSLHPANTSRSRAIGAYGNTQVGVTQTADPGEEPWWPEVPTHAALWSGTADSWVDLQPDSWGSYAVAVWERFQVGWTVYQDFEGPTRACIWQGSPSTYTDLHQFLSSDFDESKASDVWFSGSKVYVIGTGEINSEGGGSRAVMWIGTPTE